MLIKNGKNLHAKPKIILAVFLMFVQFCYVCGLGRRLSFGAGWGGVLIVLRRKDGVSIF